MDERIVRVVPPTTNSAASLPAAYERRAEPTPLLSVGGSTEIAVLHQIAARMTLQTFRSDRIVRHAATYAVQTIS
jgi:hypothetical protein